MLTPPPGNLVFKRRGHYGHEGVFRRRIHSRHLDITASLGLAKPEMDRLPGCFWSPVFFVTSTCTRVLVMFEVPVQLDGPGGTWTCQLAQE